MSDREIVAAALRWHTAHAARLVVSAEKRREQQNSKQHCGFASASSATDKRHTEAKRLEMAALRTLAKACTKARHGDVTDVPDVNITRLPDMARNCLDVHHQLTTTERTTP